MAQVKPRVSSLLLDGVYQNQAGNIEFEMVLQRQMPRQMSAGLVLRLYSV